MRGRDRSLQWQPSEGEAQKGLRHRQQLDHLWRLSQQVRGAHLKHNAHQNPLEDLVTPPHPRVSLSDLRLGPKICISSKFPSEACQPQNPTLRTTRVTRKGRAGLARRCGEWVLLLLFLKHRRPFTGCKVFPHPISHATGGVAVFSICQGPGAASPGPQDWLRRWLAGESHPDLVPLPVHLNCRLCSIHGELSREDWPLFLNIYYVTLVPLLEHHGHRPT